VFSSISTLETALYMRNQLLRDSDWAGMAHGIEIRVPYVDIELLRAAPTGAMLKSVDAKKLLSQVPSKGLPAQATDRRKTGFSVPLSRWMAGKSDHFTSDSRGGRSSRAWARQLWSQIEQGARAA
jgi:asparagine synthase (glutamine-hydrolysing)